MSSFWRGFRWLMGTPWPLYASVLLFTNVAAAIAIMAFVRYLIPMPEARQLAKVAAGFAPVGICLLYTSDAADDCCRV